jgi:hypothetical protein
MLSVLMVLLMLVAYVLRCLPPSSAALCLSGGKPLVVSDPAGPVGSAFMELGATVVREVAKLSAASKYGVSWDEQQQLFRVVLPPAGPAGGTTGAPEEPFFLEAGLVRANDTSARSINEWTGEALGAGEVPAGIKPIGVAPMGNYAVQIQWEDGFSQVRCGCLLGRWLLCCWGDSSGCRLWAVLRTLLTHACARCPVPAQVAPYELLRSLKSQAVEPAIMEVGGVKVTVEMQ